MTKKKQTQNLPKFPRRGAPTNLRPAGAHQDRRETVSIEEANKKIAEYWEEFIRDED